MIVRAFYRSICVLHNVLKYLIKYSFFFFFHADKLSAQLFQLLICRQIVHEYFVKNLITHTKFNLNILEKKYSPW